MCEGDIEKFSYQRKRNARNKKRKVTGATGGCPLCCACESCTDRLNQMKISVAGGSNVPATEQEVC